MKHTLTQMIGINIKDARIMRRLSQKDLADKAEVTQPALCYIEQGERNPSISTLDLLANALDVSMAWLLRNVKS